MKTKIVNIKVASGNKEVLLYQNENTGKWTSNKTEALDCFHSLVMDSADKRARVIKKYYSECVIEYTRNKIRSMVNEGKIDQLYDTIINEIIQNR